MNIDYKLIGLRVKDKRRSISLTQEKMSELLNVSVGYVSQIERGITKPNLEMLSAISKILKCDIAELISNTTVEKSDFLNREINELLSGMTSKQKQMLMDIAEIIKRNQDADNRADCMLS